MLQVDTSVAKHGHDAEPAKEGRGGRYGELAHGDFVLRESVGGVHEHEGRAWHAWRTDVEK